MILIAHLRDCLSIKTTVLKEKPDLRKAHHLVQLRDGGKGNCLKGQKVIEIALGIPLDRQPGNFAEDNKRMLERSVVVEMAVNKECKSCVRFAAEGQSAAEVCRTLYVQNEALDKLGKPSRIRVTIEGV
ncbi:hypothetical protein ES708_29230 [subsurface metagenome]